VSKVEIAGPGFINFKISQPCRLATIRRVFEQGAAFGRRSRARASR
jgi:arginyl-tRNA synthetase